MTPTTKGTQTMTKTVTTTQDIYRNLRDNGSELVIPAGTTLPVIDEHFVASDMWGEKLELFSVTVAHDWDKYGVRLDIGRDVTAN